MLTGGLQLKPSSGVTKRVFRQRASSRCDRATVGGHKHPAIQIHAHQKSFDETFKVKASAAALAISLVLGVLPPTAVTVDVAKADELSPYERRLQETQQRREERLKKLRQQAEEKAADVSAIGDSSPTSSQAATPPPPPAAPSRYGTELSKNFKKTAAKDYAKYSNKAPTVEKASPTPPVNDTLPFKSKLDSIFGEQKDDVDQSPPAVVPAPKPAAPAAPSFSGPAMPKFEAPKLPDMPKFEAPKFEAPKMDMPKFDMPKMPEPPEVPNRVEPPKLPPPVVQAPVAPALPAVPVPPPAPPVPVPVNPASPGQGDYLDQWKKAQAEKSTAKPVVKNYSSSTPSKSASTVKKSGKRQGALPFWAAEFVVFGLFAGTAVVGVKFSKEAGAVGVAIGKAAGKVIENLNEAINK